MLKNLSVPIKIIVLEYFSTLILIKKSEVRLKKYIPMEESMEEKNQKKSVKF